VTAGANPARGRYSAYGAFEHTAGATEEAMISGHRRRTNVWEFRQGILGRALINKMR